MINKDLWDDRLKFVKCYATIALFGRSFIKKLICHIPGESGDEAGTTPISHGSGLIL